MAHVHGHHANQASSSRILTWALGANGALLVVQVLGVMVFSSLALAADAVHQGSDVLALSVAVVALAVANRGASGRYSYGLRRAEVMGALLNAVLLVAAAGWIVVEASRRIGDAPDVDGWGVAAVALAGLAVNGGSAWLLGRTGDHSVNVQGAALHLLGDAAGSFGALVAGLSVVFWDAAWVDPAVSYLIAALLLWSGVGLIRRTARILLEGAPGGFDVDELSGLMTAHEQVDDVHHVHVWAVDSTLVALSAHVVVAADTLHDAQIVAAELEARLAEEGVAHATLALECHPCQDAESRDS